MNVEQALEFLNSIPNINNGGCGVVGIVMGRIFGENKISYLMVYDSDLFMDIDQFNISEGNFGDVEHAFHVIFTFDGKNYYDSTGIVNFYLEYPSIEITFDELLEIVKRANWNNEFEREKWIPVIEERLGIKIF